MTADAAHEGDDGAAPNDHAWAKIEGRLQSARAQDHRYRDGRILGSMCSEPHPLAVRAHAMFLETNLGDPGHFPGTQQLETEYLDRLLALAGGSPGQHAAQATSGGSEANFLALAAMRERGTTREVIVPATGHFSLEKAAKFLGLKLRIADVDQAYRVRASDVAALIGPQTAGIVAIAGSTQVGSVDDVSALAALANEARVPCHVDAAFGGYVLPFLAPPRAFGLALEGVTSITMDSHKMGMSTPGVGALLVRDPEDLERLAVDTPYLTTPRQRGVLGTRSGAPVAAAWALFEGLGFHGYRRAVRSCMATTRVLLDELAQQDVHPLVQPELNIVAIPVADPVAAQERLSRAGWRVNVLPRLSALRVVCNPHVPATRMKDFAADLSRAIAQEVMTHDANLLTNPTG